ncbi:Crp/Fnr family transcriptional regulator [Belliella kenyensis]|uniref:Crp/Fnr family transcriptional regulator n=1 Tax=Belliella kenyensis TaxID=1472724 RepID=A0ABV8ELB0_9BACT|nr:Crp/Fnr family transcriptional regulator [Belliella kenyensis]MCH7403349.1 Crp/Fnr family transcriptional regulator [Belliella kenyensis]MDN3602990.1 Crp/Fnr family transcriptional regulator [Belliella kenyensis]
MSDNKQYIQFLKSSFDKYYQTRNEAWEEFVHHCSVVSFSKEEVVKEQNTTERYFYFIIEGSVGLFLWKENNFVCLDFAFEGQFCSDYMSILTNESTPLQLRALENCRMLRMSKESYHKITHTPLGSVIRTVAAEASFIDKQLQQIDLLTKTAKQRYEVLLCQFPNIQNRISQSHIASYLGITPQSLSRIRREK